MTEKELKKLSRLELLELLLEVGSENQELKQRVEKLNKEIETARQIERLSDTITQAKSVLKDVNRLATSTSCADSITALVAEAPEPSLLDKEIYRCLLRFYAEDKTQLSALPLELKIAIEERMVSVLE